MRVRTSRARLLCGTLPFALLLVSACSVDLVHDLDEQEANEAVLCLERRGISVEKQRTERGGRPRYALSVPRSESLAALAALGAAGIPRQKGQGVADLLGSSPLLSSSQKERALLERAVAGELSRTLREIDGVIEARVHVVVPERDPLATSLAGESPKPRASVLLRASRRPLAASEADIRRLVAGAVPGLAVGDVTLVVVESRASSAAGKAPSSAPELARLGPFLVAGESKGPLLWSIAAGLLLLVLLGGGTILLFRRNQSLVRLVSGEAGVREKRTSA
jgi:type III secretion protein J